MKQSQATKQLAMIANCEMITTVTSDETNTGLFAARLTDHLQHDQ
jgi:hypothetical protein